MGFCEPRLQAACWYTLSRFPDFFKVYLKMYMVSSHWFSIRPKTVLLSSLNNLNMHFFQIKFSLVKTSKVFLMCAGRNIFGLQEGKPIDFINIHEKWLFESWQFAFFSNIWRRDAWSGKVTRLGSRRIKKKVSDLKIWNVIERLQFSG